MSREIVKTRNATGDSVTIWAGGDDGERFYLDAVRAGPAKAVCGVRITPAMAEELIEALRSVVEAREQDRARLAGREHFSMAGPRANGPLSGEWAGESIPELSDQYGIGLWNPDTADAFEEGFALAEDEAYVTTELDAGREPYTEGI